MKQLVFCSRCRNFFRLNYQSFKSFSSTAVLLSQSPNYYDLLKISQDASPTEVKAAYIELSKTHHPDKNLDKPNQHDEFVEINIAYEILSKPLLRREYDRSLKGATRIPVTQVYRTNRQDPYGAEAASAGSGWYRDFNYGTVNDGEDSYNYYGIKGIKRMGNTSVLYGCIAILCFSGAILFTVFKHSSEYTIKRLDAKDRRISEMYNEAKAKLRENGNKKQLEIMRQRHEEFQKRRLAEMAGPK